MLRKVTGRLVISLLCSDSNNEKRVKEACLVISLLIACKKRQVARRLALSYPH